MNELSNKTDKKIKIIGVGGGGSTIVEHLSNKYSNRYESIILTKDKNSITSEYTSTKILLSKLDDSDSNVKYDSVIDKLKSFINTDKKVFIFATLGGECGSSVVKVLSQYLPMKDLEIEYFLITPFAWEGINRINIANETIEFLENNNAKITLFSNDNILKSDNITMKECFNMQDEEFHQIISSSLLVM